MDLNLRVQANLLKFIENDGLSMGEKRKAGLSMLRFIFATNKDLEKAMMTGALRMDLYYRLHGISLDIPALRDRSEDIVAIAKYYLNILVLLNPNFYMPSQKQLKSAFFEESFAH